MILKGVISIDTLVLWYVIAGVITLLLVVLLVLGRTKEAREEQRRLKEYRKRQEKAKKDTTRNKVKKSDVPRKPVHTVKVEVPNPETVKIPTISEQDDDLSYQINYGDVEDDVETYTPIEDNPSLFEEELKPEKRVIYSTDEEYTEQSLADALKLGIERDKQDYINQTRVDYSEEQFQDLVNQFRNDKTLYRTYDVEYRAKKYVEDSMVLDNSSLATEVAQIKIVQELLKFKKYVPVISLFLVFITGGTFLFWAFTLFFIFQAKGVIDKNNATYLASQLLGSANHLTLQEALFYAKVYRKIKLDSYESIVDGLTIGEWYVDQQQRESLVDYTTFKEIKNELQK